MGIEVHRQMLYLGGRLPWALCVLESATSQPPSRATLQQTYYPSITITPSFPHALFLLLLLPFSPTLCFNSHLLLICHHSVRIKNLNVIDTHFRNTQTHLQMLPETSSSSYDMYQNCYSLPISLSIFMYCIFLYFSPTFSSSSLCLTLLPFVSLTMSNTK